LLICLMFKYLFTLIYRISLEGSFDLTQIKLKVNLIGIEIVQSLQAVEYRND